MVLPARGRLRRKDRLRRRPRPPKRGAGTGCPDCGGGSDAAYRADMKWNKMFLGILAVVMLSGCATTKDDALQRNKQLVRRYFDAWVNRCDSAVADELIATNVVLRNAPEVITGLAEDKARIAEFHRAFPDARYSVDDTIAEGDRVVVRWTLRALLAVFTLGVLGAAGIAGTSTAAVFE